MSISAQIEEEVQVKQPDTWGTIQWERNLVTVVQWTNTVLVDYVPWHILDIKQMTCLSDEEAHFEESQGDVYGKQVQRFQ